MGRRHRFLARGSLGSPDPEVPGAGLTLAIANSLSDLEKDRGTGVRSVAVALGRERTFALDAALMLGLQAIAAATAPQPEADARSLAVGIAGACIAWIGVGLAAAHNDRARQAGWEVQAVGIVLLGAAWLSALSSVGALAR
jgi:4-hydroxybenzoate polyprenyltransferase